jgi:AP-2 complex subunit mu-1
VLELFRIHVISAKQVRSPILVLGSTSFYHIKHQNIYICAISKTNANTALVFEFLNKFTSLGISYFGLFDEDSVKNNFTLIYELTDGTLNHHMFILLEICDFGFPQTTDIAPLKMLITTEGIKSQSKPQTLSKIAVQATGSVSWRRPDITYRKNEAFLDVIEDVNLILSATGTVLKCDVTSRVVMKTYLTGMPECRLGLNDKLQLERDPKKKSLDREVVSLDDYQFHQCVRLTNFETDKTIIFIPPDGEFELMKYLPLLLFIADIELHKTLIYRSKLLPILLKLVIRELNISFPLDQIFPNVYLRKILSLKFLLH